MPPNTFLLRDRILSPTEPVSPSRSALMARVRGQHTKPELIVRRCAHALGYRFRLHRRGLPGTPDLVFPRLRKAIFVHGCFWHRHACCSKTTTPKTRSQFWREKFRANLARDRRNQKSLRLMGWDILIVWECETNDAAALRTKLQRFLKVHRGPRQGDLRGQT